MRVEEDYQNIILVSDRHGVHDADRLSDFQVRVKSERDSRDRWSSMPEDLWNSKIKDKKVVLLIHGYNNDYEEASEYFSNLAGGTKDLYDTHVGYLWPGSDDPWEYFDARSLTMESDLSLRLLKLIEEISSDAAQIDIIAFSMGCRLVLEAVKKGEQMRISNVFFMAPAIDNESLERGEISVEDISQVENLFVFYSRRDEVLSLLYPMFELDRALGSGGPENLENVHPNVHLVDSSRYINNHSDYSSSDFIFKHIAKGSKEGSLSAESI
ncbi:MAG: alpha/beta hydrolase [Candidatus Algichlamydia australiensis]|nr:alpha/beta hydrolase [Chlamydiales bacterium]